MSNDILKDYFSQLEITPKEPRDGFKEELIIKLNIRIAKLERRKRYYSILSAISLVVVFVAAIGYYMPLNEFAMPKISFSPSYLVLTFLLFMLIFIGSYITDTMKLATLRREIEALK